MVIKKQLLGCILLGWAISAGSFSPPALSSEAEIEAAFIFNIVKYTNWPEASLPNESHLLLCYVGVDSPLGEAIAGLHEKRIGTITIEVRKTTRLSNLGACHVVVLGQDMDFETVRKAVSSFALTVGEGENFVNQGGGIGLFRLDDRIRFDVNLDSTKSKGLKISANLLRLAHNVQGKQ